MTLQDSTYVSTRCISSHFFPTLPIHPFDPDEEEAAFGTEEAFAGIDRVSCGDALAEVQSSCPDRSDGLESESFDLRRRVEFGDLGEFTLAASAKTSALFFTLMIVCELASSSWMESSSENDDSKEDAEDCDSRWLCVDVDADEVVPVDAELKL